MSIFISVDPLAEKTMSAYGYCYNDPLNFIDPTGMKGEDPKDPPFYKKITGKLIGKTEVLYGGYYDLPGNMWCPDITINLPEIELTAVRDKRISRNA